VFGISRERESLDFGVDIIFPRNVIGPRTRTAPFDETSEDFETPPQAVIFSQESVCLKTQFARAKNPVPPGARYEETILMSTSAGEGALVARSTTSGKKTGYDYILSSKSFWQIQREQKNKRPLTYHFVFSRAACRKVLRAEIGALVPFRDERLKLMLRHLCGEKHIREKEKRQCFWYREGEISVQCKTARFVPHTGAKICFPKKQGFLG
jgi:hypothetical protein